MAILALKGHSTRGKEVIEILEMLGGKNLNNLDGASNMYYLIGLIVPKILGTSKMELDKTHVQFQFTYFTLEEFLEKYPYKVGDEVEFKSIGDANLKSKIIYMEWCNSLNKVLYTTEDAQVISTEDIIETKSIPPYMDYDIKEDKDIIEPTTEINLNHPCFDGHDKIELIIPENWKFEQRGNKMFGIRKYPQYPKTYEECYDILGILKPSDDDSNIYGYKTPLLSKFQKLLICRDAYWKIAGEQMGLGKPWEPTNETVYCISRSNNVIKSSYRGGKSNILEFPTPEMRDAFYDNFKYLIEQCKELL